MNTSGTLEEKEKVEIDLRTGLDFNRQKELTIKFDKNSHTVLVNKNLVPPISWFLTDHNGDLCSMGQIKDNRYSIDLSGLSKGTYILRIAGEVFTITNNK